jgi:hypothetical protein
VLTTANLVNGQATMTAQGWAAGGHAITALYGGDSSFLSNASATATATVDPAATTTTLTSSGASVFGQSVTFTANVTASGLTVSAGTVTFTSNGVTLGSAAVQGGVASLTTTALPVGSVPVVASFVGDPNFLASSATLSQGVDPASTQVILTRSVGTAVYGQSVTYTAIVTAQAGGPSGTVTFFDGTTLLGTAPLVQGQASLTEVMTDAGTTHTILALYHGDTQFTGSTSPGVSVDVSKANTQVVLTGQPSGASARGGTSLNLNVLPVLPGGGIPSGVLSLFLRGRRKPMLINLVNGHASLSLSRRSLHRIRSVGYLGNGNFNASQSGGNAAGAAISLT